MSCASVFSSNFSLTDKIALIARIFDALAI